MNDFDAHNDIFCQAELLNLFGQIYALINGQNSQHSLITRIDLANEELILDIIEIIHIIYVYFKEILPEDLYHSKETTCLESFKNFVQESYSK